MAETVNRVRRRSTARVNECQERFGRKGRTADARDRLRFCRRIAWRCWMKRWWRTWTSAAVIAAASTSLVAGQEARSWKATRTAWGDPDLQGTWTNETITPFERP